MRGATAGVVAGAVALAGSELLAAVVPSTPSLVAAVGQDVIIRVPPVVEDVAIEVFGTADKVALVVGIVVVSLALAAALGAVAVRRFSLAVLGFVMFGVVGTLSAMATPGASVPGTVLTGALAVGGGVAVLRRLVVALARPPASAPRSPPEGAEWGRRRFVRLAGTGAGLALVAAAAGRGLARWVSGGSGPSDVVLRSPAASLPSPVPATALDVEGLSPLFTPNADFYRIDTALVVPRVDLADWRLRVTGMVDRPFELTFAELLDLDQVEADITLSCVSNEVGGDLVGNARWQGVPLVELLDRAGVRPGATQIVGRSIDGWTGGFPTDAVGDGRGALVAVGMNGEPLPLDHGFPARLVVAGLYGYVSATKWLGEIELTTLDAFDGYWVPRGWSKLGPVDTQARIDVPRPRARLPAGRHVIAGVAWAPSRGIARVEVSVDEERWNDAVLSDALGVDAWRQWRYEWDARPGRHEIRVRATDGEGRTQTAERSLPRPDGATGHHTVAVTVVDGA
ncbi:MAG: molybdopterin-dependent oxidoreductase [Actinobacteria bacterium]|nr:molybdopterin-dependent oxidoreductase [Actinomycetota bacterium]